MRDIIDILLFTSGTNGRARTISPYKTVGLVIFLYLCVRYYFGQRSPRTVHAEKTAKGQPNEFWRRTELVSQKFRPSFLLFNGFLQTLFGGVMSKRLPKPDFHEEVFKFADGGQTMLEWLYCETRPKGIVTIVPGLTGNSKEIYIINTVDAALSNGYHAVVVNHRGGYPGMQITSPKLY